MMKIGRFSRVIPSHSPPDNDHLISRFHRSFTVATPKSQSARLKIRLVTGVLFLAWVLVGFGWVWFARALDLTIGDWTLNFWAAAQGSVLFFLLITVVNAWLVNRWEKDIQDEEAQEPPSSH
jgi:putative solute:sodium symporter small subunit